MPELRLYVEADVEGQPCRVGRHTHEMQYVYSMSGDGATWKVFQCPSSLWRMQFNGFSWSSITKPTHGYRPVKLSNGKIVTSRGKVSDAVETKDIQDSDPWPASAAEQYKLPTKYQGWSAEDMGF
jgi:hypothetical protein